MAAMSICYKESKETKYTSRITNVRRTSDVLGCCFKTHLTVHTLAAKCCPVLHILFLARQSESLMQPVGLG